MLLSVSIVILIGRRLVHN